ncbi:hypothetical protein KQX54_019483 [Cotesia glomerata]|uniref:Uncharacterized protein n=1 Tax=Cotesia glomerata TaxID=32391 RepID=A0AAV7HZA8_COTGL|nr:hypothetical protein KQX54_019483 [Cotesia glomerata]
MGIKKIIWWLILVYSYDKIWTFNDILNRRSPTPHTQMGQLFKSCYSSRLNPVVITTNLIDMIDELRVDDISFPVMTINHKKYFQPRESVFWGCSQYVLNNSSNACLTYSELQVADALKHKLHVTKTFDLKFYMTYWVRKNWALTDRINQIALKMSEAGLLDHWDKKTLHWPLQNTKKYESISSSTEYEQFEQEYMLFIYLLLFLTTTLAFIVFAFEMLLKKIQPRKKLRLQQQIVIFNRRVHVINEWV